MKRIKEILKHPYTYVCVIAEIISIYIATDFAEKLEAPFWIWIWILMMMWGTANFLAIAYVIAKRTQTW